MLAVTGQTEWLLLGGMWTWGLWIRKAVECFKWGLMDYTVRSREDSDAGLMQAMMAWLKRFEKRILVCSLEIVPSCDVLTLSGHFLPFPHPPTPKKKSV